jgi:flagellar assembly protein FliH
MERYFWVKAVAILSDKGEVVQLWEAPFFEHSSTPTSPVALAELQAIAQARGFQAGKEEGLASGKADAEAIINSITAIAEQMTQPYLGLESLITRELTHMAMLLAEHVVRRELTIDSSVVTAVVREAMLTLYKLEGEIVIFVNPVDAELVRNFSPECLEGKSWKVVEDVELSPGGCQVKTPTSFLDASIEKQLEEVFTNLAESCDQNLEP